METALLTDISTAQKASWDHFSSGWRKWDKATMHFLGPVGKAIVEHLGASGNSQVLDIAAGTGQPGLTIARHLSPEGKVFITDLSSKMLQVAKEKAAAAGVTNVEFREADANELPFADNSMDGVSCRFGFMFFPDLQRAANEMARVLKPDGRLAVAVWAAPEQNFWVTCMMDNIKKRIDVPPVQPGAPGMFRCAKPGLMADLFKNAGLKEVTERPVPSTYDLSGGEEFWTMTTEIAAPFAAALHGVDPATVALIKADVVAEMDERFPDGKITGLATVITAVK